MTMFALHAPGTTEAVIPLLAPPLVDTSFMRRGSAVIFRSFGRSTAGTSHSSTGTRAVIVSRSMSMPDKRTRKRRELALGAPGTALEIVVCCV
jgi:hypothetical protein